MEDEYKEIFLNYQRGVLPNDTDIDETIEVSQVMWGYNDVDKTITEIENLSINFQNIEFMKQMFSHLVSLCEGLPLLKQSDLTEYTEEGENIELRIQESRLIEIIMEVIDNLIENEILSTIYEDPIFFQNEIGKLILKLIFQSHILKLKVFNSGLFDILGEKFQIFFPASRLNFIRILLIIFDTKRDPLMFSQLSAINKLVPFFIANLDIDDVDLNIAISEVMCTVCENFNLLDNEMKGFVFDFLSHMIYRDDKSLLVYLGEALINIHLSEQELETQTTLDIQFVYDFIQQGLQMHENIHILLYVLRISIILISQGCLMKLLRIASFSDFEKFVNHDDNDIATAAMSIFSISIKLHPGIEMEFLNSSIYTTMLQVLAYGKSNFKLKAFRQFFRSLFNTKNPNLQILIDDEFLEILFGVLDMGIDETSFVEFIEILMNYPAFIEKVVNCEDASMIEDLYMETDDEELSVRLKAILDTLFPPEN